MNQILTRTLILLTLIIGSLTFYSCDSEENQLTLNVSSTNLKGVRGSELTITLDAFADGGIAEINIDPLDSPNIIIPLTKGPTSYQFDYLYTIPGNALLGQEFDILFSVTDLDKKISSQAIQVVAIPLLPIKPERYTFERNNVSSVSYSGQNERLAMLEQMLEYLSLGDNGQALSSSILMDAFTNTNENGNGFFSFSSTKQLRNKSFVVDLDDHFFETLFAETESASLSPDKASNGIAGLITLELQNKMALVNSQGHVLSNFLEKGIMGSVMLNQVYNTYFSDGRTGDEVENTALRESTQYTDMEHHWDEAFGYWNPPIDFSSSWPIDRNNETRFWSFYSNEVDGLLGLNSTIMDAFLEGRTAIVNNDLISKNIQRALLVDQLELLTAANALVNINKAIMELENNNQGELLYTISDAWGFVNAITYIPTRRLDILSLDEIKEINFGAGNNFWNVTPEGLKKAKAILVNAYSELEPIQDDL